MFDLYALWRRIAGYVFDTDALTATSNKIALILASNQPFFLIYVYWATGETNASLGLTFLSTPLFLATPWITKRFPGVGRLWFPAIGAINTFFCGFVFGEASGVEWFIMPCIVIAFLSCRATERVAFFIFCAIVACAFIALHGRYGIPIFQNQTAQASLRSLNIYSATILSLLALWTLGRARYEPKRLASK